MAAPDLKTAQKIAHMAAEIVEAAIGDLDRLVSAAIERGDLAEGRRLGTVGEGLSREAERLRDV